MQFVSKESAGSGIAPGKHRVAEWAKWNYERVRTAATAGGNVIVNKTMSLSLVSKRAKKLEEKANSEKKQHETAVELGETFGFWPVVYGLSKLGEKISQFTGPIIGYTVALMVPAGIKKILTTVKKLTHKEKNAGKPDEKNFTDYLFNIGLTSLAVVPTYFLTIQIVVDGATRHVSALRAAVAIIAATITSTIAEWGTFALFWKANNEKKSLGNVLKDLTRIHEWKDFFRGVKNGFNEAIFRKEKESCDQCQQNLMEEAGHLMAIRDFYFLPIQLMRTFWAVLIGMGAFELTTAKDFIDTFFVSLSTYLGWFNTYFVSLSYKTSDKKLQEYNKQPLEQNKD
ncbi:MAG: hypothetical protein AABW86_02900 [Candidatus Micrarchaeota archaeon]